MNSLLSGARQAFEPVLRRVLHLYWRFARGMTLGVRGMAIDTEGRILLIQHSYVGGWHLPGGGVEVGETMLESLGREMHEEANVTLIRPPALHGIFFNNSVSRRDHVAVYVIRDFRQDSAPVPDREIIAHGFFSPGALPPETTRATRERIDEVLNGRPKADVW